MPRLFLIMTCLCSLRVSAQFLDTLHNVFNQRSHVDARLESRYGLINNTATMVRGVRLGIAFNRKLRLGGGLSWLNTNYFERRILIQENNEVIITDRYLKFAYLCFYADFVFHKTKRWQLSVPIQIGGGGAWYQDRAKYDLNAYPKYAIFLYEPGITVQFKIFRWLGLGSDFGCRMVLKDKRITERISSPIISLKLMLWPDQLYYLLFPKSKMSTKKGPAVW